MKLIAIMIYSLNPNEVFHTRGHSGWRYVRNWRVRSAHPDIAPYYRDKGITVCDEWRRSFTAFLAHIKAMPRTGLTVDRINGNGNYEPGNVRWATRREQIINQPRRRVA